MILGPTGLAGVVWPDGDLAMARAAAAAGVGFCQSTTSSNSIEQVAAAGRRDHWFQLYVQKDRGLTASLMERARLAGCPVLVLTVDMPLQGTRERDVRNGFTVPPRLGLDNLFDYARRLGWLWRMANGPRLGFGNLEEAHGPKRNLTSLAAHIGAQFDASVSWKDLEWLRAQWPGKLAIKGILHPKDASFAVSHGADAVIVSNHGGRQLDGTPAALAALPGIVEAVDGQSEVLMDGGVRRGSDIVKAMALGARACLIGRAGLYGLAAGGEAGVASAVSILQKEIDITQALLGVADLSLIDQDVLWKSAA
jgi:L-lactate dehydrogenase (cytochrome)